MLNIQPDMKSTKQTRRAISEICGYLADGQAEKACYAMDMLNEMLDTINIGKPQPWSNFQPRLLEEFS